MVLRSSYLYNENLTLRKMVYILDRTQDSRPCPPDDMPHYRSNTELTRFTVCTFIASCTAACVLVHGIITGGAILAWIAGTLIGVYKSKSHDEVMIWTHFTEFGWGKSTSRNPLLTADSLQKGSVKQSLSDVFVVNLHKLLNKESSSKTH